MKIYFITTDHFLDRLWFKDDEDFRTAMNYIAVVSIITGVRVLAFILMSNHIHLVLYCYDSDAKLFIDTFKKLYGAYFAGKYKVGNYFRKLGVDIQIVPGEDEAPEKVIAYVQMNCVAANICSSAFFYPWGTGACFFNEAPEIGNPVSGLSRRAQIRMTRSNVKLPEYFRYGKGNYILPDSYVNIRGVEALFKSAKRYIYFLNNSSKAKKVLDNKAMPSFSDQSILASAKDLCRSLFKEISPVNLNKKQMSDLIKELKYRFSADVKQLSRVLNLSYEEASTLLDL